MFTLNVGHARVVLKEWQKDDNVLTLRQVHSSEVYVLGSFIQGLQGDAIITTTRRLKIGVKTADCVPVALLGRETVAVVHAGWRGLKEGIVEKTLSTLTQFEPVENFLAFVGPSAKACCYEVGKEFKEYFHSIYFKKSKYYMDTQEEAIIKLKAFGVKNFYVYRVCTICHYYFPSHRRDRSLRRLLTFAELL